MKQYKNWLQGKVLYWLKIRTFDTVTWKGYTVVYIKYTRARVQVWALWALNFYNSTLSSKGSWKTSRSWYTCSQKHVRNKEKERNRQCLLVHSSVTCTVPPSLPPSISLKFQWRQLWGLQETLFPETANLPGKNINRQLIWWAYSGG